jgi:hypothetical protein
MTLFQILADLEENEELHLARLLVLLGTFAGKNKAGTVEGLTKLAKLDFLLRYPVYLERALEARKTTSPSEGIKPKEEAAVQEHERHSVESAMVRYKYGPWDFRYRRFLNLLIALGLATVNPRGRTFHIGLTAAGVQKAKELTEKEENSDLVGRSKAIKRHFDIGGTSLKDFVYATFPEIVSLRLGEEIRHEH